MQMLSVHLFVLHRVSGLEYILLLKKNPLSVPGDSTCSEGGGKGRKDPDPS